MIRPLTSFRFISSTHGQPTNMGSFGKHLGVDYATGVGTVVVAPCNAIVIETGYSSSVGLYVILKDEKDRIHRLLHLNSENVSLSQYVTEGQFIATSGQTGTNITGPHLHWDVRKANTLWNASFDNYFNPESLIATAPPKPDSTVTPDDIGKTIYLSSKVTSWSVYRVGTTAKIASVNPNRYGGLAYRIIGIDTFRPQRVIIQTSYYGRVALPVDTDAEIR